MIGLRHGAFLAAGLTFVGCVSINSKSLEDRMCAVAKMTTQEELRAAVWDTNYEDVRVSAVKRIVEQQVLAAIVEAPRFSDAVKCIALSAITNQAYLADIAVADTCLEEHAEIAIQGVSHANLLYKCIKGTRFKKIAIACVEKLNDEIFLKQIALDNEAGVCCRERCLMKIKSEAVLCDVALGTSDAWIHDIVATRITESSSASRLIVAPNVSDTLKALLVGRITDEAFLAAYVKDNGHAELVRRMCLEKIEREDCCTSLLRHVPVLEDWVILHSIAHIADANTIIETVLNREFSDKCRAQAFTRLSGLNEFEKVFELARDDLSVNQSVKRLSCGYINSKRGQTSVVKNFRIVEDDLLRGELLLLMKDETLIGLYKGTDQIGIAKAIAASQKSEVLIVAKKALFDVSVMLDLALGKFSGDDKAAYWALAMISDENHILHIALNAKKKALRMEAITRLSKKSEKILNELAQNDDVAIKTSAIERLKILGGTDVAKFECRAEIERQEQVAKARKKAEERKAREEREKKEFEERYLTVAGISQLRIVRKYVELNAKAHIESPTFQVTGRVVQFSGRDVVLKMHCESGEVQVSVEMNRKVGGVLSIGEIVTISGCDDKSTKDQYRLRCGELVDRGIRLK